MFIKIVLYLIFISAVVQSQSINKLQREGYEIENVNKDIIKVESLFDGSKTYFKISNFSRIDSVNADLTVDLRFIDTSQYSKKYSLWSIIPIGYPGSSKLNLIDANENNKMEIYGAYFYNNVFNYKGVIYEYNSQNIFDSTYCFPDSILGGFTYSDIDNDSLIDVAFRKYIPERGYSMQFQTPSAHGELPLTVKSIYDTIEGLNSPNLKSMKLYDINSDGIDEFIYNISGWGINHIAVYDTSTDKFTLIYENTPSWAANGFAFGDFDSDGKQNFSNGSVEGELFMYEHVAEDSYKVDMEYLLPTENAYLSLTTNDIDCNGKPELWIGGQSFYNNIPKTVLCLFESDSDDEYKIVYRIDVIGVFSLFAYNMYSSDMDNDEKDEIILCIDQHVLIFKLTGDGQYSLDYIKRNDLYMQNSVFYSAIAADIDNDDYPELLICMDLIENDKLKIFTRMYKRANPSSLSEETNKKNVFPELKNAYPNPFNLSTRLEFFLYERADISIKIFNILGKEIKSFSKSTLEKGGHSITWDSSDNEGNIVPSGIYLLRLESSSFSKTTKLLLIK